MIRSRSVTTPVFYVNDNPRLAQLYSMVAADVFVRYKRARGLPVHLSSGSDEHGETMARAARAQGLSPLELADRVVERFRAAWTRYDIQLDDFIRTSEPRHAKVVQALFSRLQAAGDIYLGAFEGRRCPTCGLSRPERQEQGLRCPRDGARLESFREDRYFFRLSKYAGPLRQLLDEREDFILPRIRQAEVRGWLDEGLEDLSVSRPGRSWGVRVPGDDEHLIYVWVDALASYLFAADWEACSDDASCTEPVWPADLQLIGRDILRQHAIYWPALLMSAGLPLPESIFAHGLWGEGRNLDPHALADAYGVDGLRYHLLRELPFGLDGEFSHHLLIDHVNGDLADELAGLFQRIMGFAEKYAGGRVPALGAWGEAEEAMEREAGELLETVSGHLEDLAFHKALESIWKWLRRVHRYLDRAAPWALGDKQRPQRDAILRCLLESMRWAASLLSVFIPATADIMLEQLGLEARAPCRWERLESLRGLEEGRALRRGPPLFFAIPAERRVALLREFEQERRGTGSGDGFASLSPEDLDRLDLRVGRIERQRATGQPGEWLLDVDLAEARPRSIMIRCESEPALEGSRVLVVANAEGVTGPGLLLVAGADLLAGFAGEAVEGTAVRPLGGKA